MAGSGGAADIRSEDEMSEWQAIETAPKDGTVIITFSPAAKKYGYRAVRENYWSDEHGGGWQRTNSHWWPPRLWQPMPDEPEES